MQHTRIAFEERKGGAALVRHEEHWQSKLKALSILSYYLPSEKHSYSYIGVGTMGVRGTIAPNNFLATEVKSVLASYIIF